MWGALLSLVSLRDSFFVEQPPSLADAAMRCLLDAVTPSPAHALAGTSTCSRWHQHTLSLAPAHALAGALTRVCLASSAAGEHTHRARRQTSLLLPIHPPLSQVLLTALVHKPTEPDINTKRPRQQHAHTHTHTHTHIHPQTHTHTHLAASVRSVSSPPRRR
eukprot:3753770-Rhodomonas_salina.3